MSTLVLWEPPGAMDEWQLACWSRLPPDVRRAANLAGRDGARVELLVDDAGQEVVYVGQGGKIRTVGALLVAGFRNASVKFPDEDRRQWAWVWERTV